MSHGTLNNNSSDEKLNAFPLRSGIRQGCPLTISIQHHIGSPNQCNKAIKIKKRNTDWEVINKTGVLIFFHRLDDWLCRKSQRNDKKKKSWN